MEIQKTEYLEEEKRLLDEIKNIFHNFFKSYHLVKKRKTADTRFFLFKFQLSKSLLASEKALYENDKKCSLFHLKSSFHSSDI